MQTKNINHQQQQLNVDLQGEQVTRMDTPSIANVYHNTVLPDTCLIFGSEVDVETGKRNTAFASLKSTPPPYRMPPHPLYSEPTIPGSAMPSAQQIHTHSNKFPIEREVVLTNCDKNSKIPILNEYHRKHTKSVVSPDAPNVQVAWIEDRINRTSRPILETTIGTEPSPILNQDDSNGFSKYSKTTGRSHSTPESESVTGKPFSSRTYHTIRDMISSRFNKSKSNQQNSSGLNNTEEKEAFPKSNEPLSPHSQLAQHGVYIASTQPPVHTTSNYSNLANSSDVTRRNQEIRNQIISQQFRERAVDVGHTVGVSQQTFVTPNPISSAPLQGASMSQQLSAAPQQNSSAIAQQVPIIPLQSGNNPCRQDKLRDIYQDVRLSKLASGSRQSIFDSETPNRFRNINAADTCNTKNEMSQNQICQSQNITPGAIRRIQTNLGPTNFPHKSSESLPSANALSIYSKPSTSGSAIIDVHNYERTPEMTQTDNSRPYQNQNCEYNQTERSHINPPAAAVWARSNLTTQISSDLKYASDTLERCNITRAKSNDHLLESGMSRNNFLGSPNDPLVKSKSFENIGNDAQKIELEKIKPITNCVNSDYEKHRSGDSGRGSTIYSSGNAARTTDASPDSSDTHRPKVKDSPWVDIVETQLKHILEPKANISIANSTLSDDSTASPPLPPVSPDVSSDDIAAAPVYKQKSSVYNSKQEHNLKYRNMSTISRDNNNNRMVWNSRSTNKDKTPHQQQHRLAISTKKPENPSRIPSTLASSSIDLESMLDEENNTSEEDASTTDTRAIRKQLEGLENMYSEVLKLLGVRKSNNSALGRYQPSDPRMNRRRMHGSISSLPSSVSSRPIKERHRRQDDKKKSCKDLKGINKRFQRLESHVVTLARSVAHLSSEMRTQHLMLQEMEVIREELASLRVQTNMMSNRSHSLPRYQHVPTSEQANSSPDKLKKLTRFFGDEPPLLRLFLKKLGYEKYAAIFEKEKIGLVELPYMSEERLHKIGIPMGPRLRILQEAQLGFPGANENTLCIV